MDRLCLKSFTCTDLSIENIYSVISFLSLQLNQFLQTEIKQKIFSVLKIARITAIVDKKTISVFCVSRVLSFPPQSDTCVITTHCVRKSICDSPLRSKESIHMPPK